MIVRINRDRLHADEAGIVVHDRVNGVTTTAYTRRVDFLSGDTVIASVVQRDGSIWVEPSDAAAIRYEHEGVRTAG